MSALGKLHRSIGWHGECPVGAVHVGRGEIVWQDRCDAANGSKEPSAVIDSNYRISREKQKPDIGNWRVMLGATWNSDTLPSLMLDFTLPCRVIEKVFCWASTASEKSPDKGR